MGGGEAAVSRSIATIHNTNVCKRGQSVLGKQFSIPFATQNRRKLGIDITQADLPRVPYRWNVIDSRILEGDVVEPQA